MNHLQSSQLHKFHDISNLPYPLPTQSTLKNTTTKTKLHIPQPTSPTIQYGSFIHNKNNSMLKYSNEQVKQVQYKKRNTLQFRSSFNNNNNNGNMERDYYQYNQVNRLERTGQYTHSGRERFFEQKSGIIYINQIKHHKHIQKKQSQNQRYVHESYEKLVNKQQDQQKALKKQHHQHLQNKIQNKKNPIPYQRHIKASKDNKQHLKSLSKQIRNTLKPNQIIFINSIDNRNNLNNINKCLYQTKSIYEQKRDSYIKNINLKDNLVNCKANNQNQVCRKSKDQKIINYQNHNNQKIHNFNSINQNQNAKFDRQTQKNNDIYNLKFMINCQTQNKSLYSSSVNQNNYKKPCNSYPDGFPFRPSNQSSSHNYINNKFINYQQKTQASKTHEQKDTKNINFSTFQQQQKLNTKRLAFQSTKNKQIHSLQNSIHRQNNTQIPVIPNQQQYITSMTTPRQRTKHQRTKSQAQIHIESNSLSFRLPALHQQSLVIQSSYTQKIQQPIVQTSEHSHRFNNSIQGFKLQINSINNTSSPYSITSNNNTQTNNDKTSFKSRDSKDEVFRFKSKHVKCPNSVNSQNYSIKKQSLLQKSAVTTFYFEKDKQLPSFLTCLNAPKNIKLQQKPYKQQNLCKINKNQTLLTKSTSYESPVFLQDFNLFNVKAEGRFGKFYPALHKKTGMLVGIKQIKKSLIHMMLDQFIQQLKIQSCVDHPNIVKLYGYFSNEQNFYIILEYMQEGSLYGEIKKKKKISEKLTSMKLKQVCEAVNYLHENQILHRDLKPENIVMTCDVCKICDFGWAAYSNSRRNTYCGTLDYICPQILGGEDYDQSVDIWSIGVLAYEMVAGKAPFYNVSKKQTIKKIVECDLIFPAEMSSSLRSFIRKALNRNPNERSSINTLINDTFLK